MSGSLITQLTGLAVLIVAWVDPAGALSVPAQGVIGASGALLTAIERAVIAYRHRTLTHAATTSPSAPPAPTRV